MRTLRAAVACLCLLLPRAAAAAKTAGNTEVLGDSLEYSAGVLAENLQGPKPSADGGLAGVAFSSSAAGTTALESGFYSKLVKPPFPLDPVALGATGYLLAWGANGNPQGTTYENFISSWGQAGDYFVRYSTSGTELEVVNLAPNASYYNYVLANYMEGDYSVTSASLAVTLAQAVSSGTFRFTQVGHNALSLYFSALSNPAVESRGLWAPLANMPKAAYAQASVVYGSHVYVSGGFTGVYASSAVYRAEYAPGQGLSAFQAVRYLPEGLYGHQMVAARGRLYVLGGRSQSAIRAAVWSAEVASDGSLGPWQREAEDLPVALYFHACAAGDGKIYLQGGYGSSGVSAGLYVGSVGGTGALTWSASIPTSLPRYAHTLTYFGDRLYLVGGRDGAAATGDVRVIALDGAGGPVSITGLSPLPAARYGHSALAVGNELYVLGGNNGSSGQKTIFSSTISAAALTSPKWQVSGELPAELQTFAAAAFGGDLFVFGGSDQGTPVLSAYNWPLAGTRYEVEVSSDEAFTAELRSSGLFSGNGWSFSDLSPGVTYYTRVKAVNRAGAASAYSAVASTLTYSATPGTAAWTEVGVTSAVVNWLANGNAPGESVYELQVSSYSDYSLLIPAADTTALSKVLTSLQANTTYYARVRVATSPGGASRYADLPTAYTAFDIASDVSSPTISVGVSPRAMAGYQGASVLCDVDFADNGSGDAGLKLFAVMVSTEPQESRDLWVDSPVDIQGQRVYDTDWTLPGPVWASVLEGASNYISVRVSDLAGNTSTYLDAFSVIPDTTPPTLVSTYAAPAGLLISYPGPADGIHLEDALSGLYKAEYSVSTNQNLADAAVVGWTLISTPTLIPGTTWFNPVIDYNFTALANAPSNYFSIRAVDVAGSTEVFTSVFSIGKFVSGPQVTLTSPAGTRLSTFTYAAGTSTGTDSPVAGTQVSLFDATDGKYYSGSAFTAGSRVWLDADDSTASYTFSMAFGGLPLTPGHGYDLVARSSDVAGNYSQNFATYSFIFDTTPPDAQLAAPADGSVFSGSSFSGSASDPAGLSSVQVAVRRVSDGKWWDGGVGWGAAPVGAEVPPAADWSWPLQHFLRDALLADGASYYVTVRASDASTPPNTGSFGLEGATFTYADRTAPPAVTALAAAAGPQRGSAALAWPAAGDNGVTGYLHVSAAFAIAHSTWSGAPVSTASAQLLISTSGLNAGATQYRLVTGLEAGASYYFTLWTRDDAGNWSGASNEAFALSGSLNTGALTGSVVDASTQAVTGVLVEALSADGAVEGSDYTDPAGNYSIAGLQSETVGVRATWTASEVESSVSKDGVQNGTSGVNFRLSVTYDLAEISGTIPSAYLPRNITAPSGSRYTTRDVRASQGGQPFAEIYLRGRRIGAAFVGQDGRFTVPNLLPGRYGVRVYNGSVYSRLDTVTLRPGERLMFTPKFDLVSTDRVFAYPNPASGSVSFHFETPSSAYEARLEVFDIAGRLVKSFDAHENDPVVPGRRFAWNFSGEGVGSGVYLYIFRIKDASGEAKPVIKKFAIVR